MFTLQSALDIITILTRLIAYFMIVTPAGAFRAWTTRKMGDPTATELGLESLNPLIHIDVIGIVCLLLFGFGWGKQIPINPLNIRGPHRGLKLFIARLSGIFIFLLLSILCLVALALLFGRNLQMLFAEQISSFVLAIGRILVESIRLCIFLAVIELVINTVYLITAFIAEKRYIDPQYLWFVPLAAALLLLLLFGEVLHGFLLKMIYSITDLISNLIGLQ